MSLSYRWSISWIFILVCLCGITMLEVRAQTGQQSTGPRRRTGDNPPVDNTASGPRRRTEEAPPETKKGELTEVSTNKTVRVAAKKGLLTLFTTPQAKILLTPVPQSGAVNKKLERQADQGGICVFQDLIPGQYKLQITREDYATLDEVVEIKQGKPTTLSGPLIEKYGIITLGLSDPSLSNAKVLLDGQEVPPERLKRGEKAISLLRVPVGNAKVSLSKAGYDNWSEQFEVKPGEPANSMSAVKMERATITLTVNTRPGAQVYIDNEPISRVPPEGALRIPGLSPGEHKLLVSLGGYANAERQLTLSLEQRDLVERVLLTPITEDKEFNDSFDAEIANWSLAQPPGWKLNAGRIVAGETVVLVKDSSKPNRPFNLYDNFKLIFKVSFKNHKGASWVVRAKDERNYYLFELTPAPSKGQEHYFKFYICRDGKLELKDKQPIPNQIDDPNDSFRIYLEAKGNTFEHFILSDKHPAPEPEKLGPTFTDDEFTVGGVGLRAINGIEMFVSQFIVSPYKK